MKKNPACTFLPEVPQKKLRFPLMHWQEKKQYSKSLCLQDIEKSKSYPFTNASFALLQGYVT